MLQTFFSKYSLLVMCGVLLGALLVATRLSSDPSSQRAKEEEDRKIVLTAEGSTFLYQDQTNPTIRVKRGDRIKIIFRNRDPGVLHAISIPDLDVSRKDVPWKNQVTFEFTPTSIGKYTYKCSHHLPMMKGTIVVEEDVS